MIYSRLTMSDDTNSTTNNNNNNNNEQHSVFTEQDKELANKAKQEYEGGQFDGLESISYSIFRNFVLYSLSENITKTP